MKAIEQNFPVVLLILLYKVILTFESVDEILKCDHSNVIKQAVHSCGHVLGMSNFPLQITFRRFEEKRVEDIPSILLTYGSISMSCRW